MTDAALTRGQDHDRTALILYGSETGNSEDAAHQLGAMTERLRFTTNVLEMDSVQLAHLRLFTIVIFVISTTGQGDFPNNSRIFWKSLLRKKLPPGCLNQVSFTTFGLGDSSYKEYNFAAKKLYKRLCQLGAKEFYPAGEGDEQHDEGIDGDFVRWSTDMRKQLPAVSPLPIGLLPIPEDEFLTPKEWLVIAEKGQGKEPSIAPAPSSLVNINSSTEFDSMKLQASTHQESSHPSHLLQPRYTLKDPISDPNCPLGTISPSDIAPNSKIEASTAQPLLPLADEAMARESATTSDGDLPHEVSPTPHRSKATVLQAQAAMNALRPASQVADFDITMGVSRIQENQKEANRSIKESVAMEDILVDDDAPPTDILPIREAHVAKVTWNSRMTAPEHFQDVRFLQLEFNERKNYGAGDILTLYPKNFPSDVDTLLKLQHWERAADEPLTIERDSYNGFTARFQPLLSRVPTTQPFTLRSLLLHNLDFTAVPRRQFLQHISHWTNDPDHKQRLQEFSNPAFTEEFFDYTTRPRRTILEILQDFSSVQIPFKYAATIFPLIRGRQFSIASGGNRSSLLDNSDWLFNKQDHTRIDLCIALVKYRTILRKVRQGLCSRWLSTLTPGSEIAVTLQRGSYPSMLPLINKPLVLVGPGTGVAPLRSLLQERERLIREAHSIYVNKAIEVNEESDGDANGAVRHKAMASEPRFGKALLIFGNRQPSSDLLFGQDWYDSHGKAKMTNFEFMSAWSRVAAKGSRENKYVQDVIRECAREIDRLLRHEGGTFFVCGSSGKMPLGVRLAVRDAFMMAGGLSEAQADKEIEDMARQKRWVQETW